MPFSKEQSELIKESIIAAARKATKDKRYDDAHTLWKYADSLRDKDNIPLYDGSYRESPEYTLKKGLPSLNERERFLERYQADIEVELKETNVPFNDSKLWLDIEERLVETRRHVQELYTQSFRDKLLKLAKVYIAKQDDEKARKHLESLLTYEDAWTRDAGSHINYEIIELLLGIWERMSPTSAKTSWVKSNHGLKMAQLLLSHEVKYESTYDTYSKNAHSCLARIHMRRGDLGEASKLVEAVFNDSHYVNKYGESNMMAKLWHLRALIEIARSNNEKALEFAKTGLALTNRLLQPIEKRINLERYNKWKSLDTRERQSDCNRYHLNWYARADFELFDICKPLQTQFEQLLTILQQPAN